MNDAAASHPYMEWKTDVDFVRCTRNVCPFGSSAASNAARDMKLRIAFRLLPVKVEEVVQLARLLKLVPKCLSPRSGPAGMSVAAMSKSPGSAYVEWISGLLELSAIIDLIFSSVTISPSSWRIACCNNGPVATLIIIKESIVQTTFRVEGLAVRAEKKVKPSLFQMWCSFFE